jgi:diguanylate cyclase (GGDEF)-like protein/PAS domain S-box-containing protein
MNLGVLTGVALLCTTAPIALVVVAFAWRSRELPGVRAFLVIIALALWWSVGSAVELLVSNLDSKLVWSNLQFLSITLLPVAFLAMALDYTGRREWITRASLAALCLVPLITNVLLWADHHRHFVRATSWLDASGSYPVVGHKWGSWFWVHAGYSYLLLALTVGLLVMALVSKPQLHRKRLVAILVGVLIAVATGFVETLVPSSSSLDDATPGTFILTALLLAWGLLRVRIFNLVPIARHALVENMKDGVLVLDGIGQVVDLNESARQLIGRVKTLILGRPLADCWEAWRQVAVPYSAGVSQAQLRLDVDGRERHYEVRSSPLARHNQVVAHLIVLSDVTDRVLLEDSLRDQALTDSLTGLPNRALFTAKLGDTIRQARRHEGTLFAVMVLDLDSFKLINDCLGHLAGDVLLQSVATKLRRCVREVDTVARMGGDEFIILLHEISSQRDLLPILGRIRDELRTPVYFRQQEMVAASSVGVVIWDASYEDPEEMVRAADTAMYQAKEDGRDCYRVFDDEMHKAVLRSQKDETDLRVAIKEHAFSLIYQPVLDLKSGTVHSLEGLLRWHHPERGTVFPRDFLAVAENSGLILALGEIALDDAFSHMNHWKSADQPAAQLPVRVNVSPRQLTEPDFVPSVLSRLAAWQIPSERLVLEITENALVRDPPRARQAMKRLRGLGVRLCLDDFGAGRSSIQHLTTFPVQELKIDPLYISGISPGNRALEIVRHIAALAHTLGIEVTAEGVERADQWELLLEAGCDLAQGYYVASPMEVDVLLEFLKDLGRDGYPGPASSASRPGTRSRGVTREPLGERGTADRPA